MSLFDTAHQETLLRQVEDLTLQVASLKLQVARRDRKIEAFRAQDRRLRSDLPKNLSRIARKLNAPIKDLRTVLLANNLLQRIDGDRTLYPTEEADDLARYKGQELQWNADGEELITFLWQEHSENIF